MPALLELADGNQADKKRFAQLMQEFKSQWNFEGLYVADAALYSEENILALSGLKWLTRVPLTVGAAAELVTELSDAALQPTTQSGYSIATLCSQ
jgi:transposase